jgi:RNA-directed DNA polymerase
VDRHRGAAQETMIRVLNSKITGWTNYYSKTACTQIFGKLDSDLTYKLLYWGKRRHSNKSTKWVVAKYWRRAQGKGWRFQTS